MLAMKKKRIFLLTMPALLAIFLLLNFPGLTQSSEQAENSDGGKDYEEVFSAGDTNGIIYINWQSPKATNESPWAAWFMGAYKNVTEYGSEEGTAYGSNRVVYLNIDLCRGVLTTNNLRYAINYSAGDDSPLYFNLLDTNGVAVTEEDLFGNLLTASNVVRYVIPAEAGTEAANIVLLDIPTAKYPDAAVIQLQVQALDARTDNAPITIHEGLLYIDEDGDFWTAEEERRNGTSDYAFDGSGGSISNYYEWINGNNNGSSTNKPDGNDDGDDDGDDNEDDSNKNGRIIYVDQIAGRDEFNGRASVVSENKKQGPKKTVGGGLAIVGTNDTMIIRPGNYKENLNLSNKDVKVFIEGKVRL